MPRPNIGTIWMLGLPVAPIVISVGSGWSGSPKQMMNGSTEMPRAPMPLQRKRRSHDENDRFSDRETREGPTEAAVGRGSAGQRAADRKSGDYGPGRRCRGAPYLR